MDHIDQLELDNLANRHSEEEPLHDGRGGRFKPANTAVPAILCGSESALKNTDSLPFMVWSAAATSLPPGLERDVAIVDQPANQLNAVVA